MLKLALIAIAAVAFLIVRAYLRQRKAHAVRLAEIPPKVVIEVKLPRAVNDANARMRRFFGRVASVTSNDKEAREGLLGQLDLIYVVDRAPNHTTPTLRFYIVTDAKAMPMVKKALKTAFEQDVEIFPHEFDPLLDVAEALRQIALAESSSEADHAGALEAGLEEESPEEKQERKEVARQSAAALPQGLPPDAYEDDERP